MKHLLSGYKDPISTLNIFSFLVKIITKIEIVDMMPLFFEIHYFLGFHDGYNISRLLLAVVGRLQSHLS